MTLHDRLAERANRTPPGDPQDVLAAARARAAADRRTGRSIPARALSAAAVLAVVAVGVSVVAAAGGGDDEPVTVGGPGEPELLDCGTFEAGYEQGPEVDGFRCAAAAFAAGERARLQVTRPTQEGAPVTITYETDGAIVIVTEDFSQDPFSDRSIGRRVCSSWNLDIERGEFNPQDCEALTDGDGATDGTSPVGDWQLDSVAVDGEAIAFSTSIRDPWVGIGADGTLSGAYPCNSFGGRVQVRDERLIVTGLSQELMGCEGAEGAAESAMARLLDSDPTWEIRDETLRVRGAGVEAQLSPRTASPTTTEPAQGSTAVWTVDDTAPPRADSDSFKALVTRVECSGGQTGEVLEPQVIVEGERIVVTFTVAPLPEGGYPCPGNDQVPYTVQLGEPIGQRTLVDGACLSGEAASTSFCEEGPTRWTP